MVQNDTELETEAVAGTEYLPTTVEEIKLKTKDPQQTANNAVSFNSYIRPSYDQSYGIRQ